MSPKQEGYYYSDDGFKSTLWYETCCILTSDSLKYVPMDPVNKFPALVQIMAGYQTGNNPLCDQTFV